MAKKNDLHERFVRVATKRTKRVLKEIEILSNCSNTRNYEYTEEEIKKIFSAIEQQVMEAKSKFFVKRSNSFSL